MSTFVEECRREWKRLGVPDLIAEEMAGDLSADLEEAEAEGVAADTLLGESAADPRRFAAMWAEARGVVAGVPAASRTTQLIALSTALVLVAGGIAAAVVLLAGGNTRPAATTAVAPRVRPVAPAVTMPSVVGETEAEAIAQLHALGFRLAVVLVSIPGLREPSGTVLSQTPAPGLVVHPRATVLLRVAGRRTPRPHAGR